MIFVPPMNVKGKIHEIYCGKPSGSSLPHSQRPPSFFFRSIISTLPRSLIKEFKIQLTMLITTEPDTAAQKPDTSNPEITPEAIISINAFITNVKRPKVRMLMGSVRIIRTGRKKAFRMPRIAAVRKALINPLTSIPFIT